MQDLQREMKDMKHWKFQMQRKGNDTKHTEKAYEGKKTSNFKQAFKERVSLKLIRTDSSV